MTGDPADQLVARALADAESFDRAGGPIALVELAGRLRGPNGAWPVLVEAREILRSRVLLDPADLAQCVALAWLVAALRLQGDRDRAATRSPWSYQLGDDDEPELLDEVTCSPAIETVPGR